ncbi:hypothetical protein [Deinococcus altitudinis]|uniref:hypothetical protein n=1 Tax=Deinococcus altitudinis TaxID=468914 RepID=UPI003891ACC7
MALNYRLSVFPRTGGVPRTVLRDDTYMRSTGLRAGLTPDLDCVEMTMNARNGPLLQGGGGPGLGLLNLQHVQLWQTASATPAEADWTAIWYGTLRQGGNPRDFSGENMVFRGMSRRLEEVTVPAGIYPSADAGAVMRQVIQAVLNGGQLGVGSVNQLIIYDPALVPDLGFTFKLADGQQVMFGKLLDQIVSDAQSKLGLSIVYGVRPDRNFFFGLKRSDELALSLVNLNFTPKEPVAETPCTVVLWTVGKRVDGSIIYYSSISADAPTYGVYTREATVGADLYPWAVSGLTTTANDGTGPAPLTPTTLAPLLEPITANENATLIFSDDDTHNVDFSMTLTEPAARLFVQIGIDNFTTGGGLIVDKHDGTGVRVYRAEEGSSGGIVRAGNATISGPGLKPNARYFNLLLTDLPSGTEISATSVPATTGTIVTRASILIDTMRPEKVDGVLLGGLALPYYQVPASAPAEIELNDFLPPSALRGKVRVPMPPASDYV